MHIVWYILVVVRGLPLTTMLEIIYLKHEFQPTKHNLVQANGDYKWSAFS